MVSPPAVPGSAKVSLLEPTMSVGDPELEPMKARTPVNVTVPVPMVAVPEPALIVGDAGAGARLSALPAPRPVNETPPDPAMKVVDPELEPTKVAIPENESVP